MKLLNVNNLNVQFNGSIILDNINFSVTHGDFINVIGPNGSGKTTLLKIVTKLIKNYSGNILINNNNLRSFNHSSLAKKIAFVPQFNITKSFAGFTVFNYVLTGRFPYINKLQGYTKKDKDKVNNILHELKIEKFKNRQLITLSGGELQKVILATALVQETEILLLDEAATYLDVKHKLEFQNIIEKLLEKGETIISVTHNINQIIQGKSKILALKNGKQLYFGSTETFFNNNLLSQVYEVQFCKFFVREIKKDYYVPYRLSTI